MIMKVISLLFFLSFINAQIALPTFQAVHKPHTAVAESGSQTFSYTGAEQTLTIPSGVESITIVAYGAQGGLDGGVAGGLGGYSTGTVSVTPGNTIYIYVGGQGTSGDGGIACNLAGGWNGGGDTGNCCGGGGGGANNYGGGGGSGYIGGVSSAETIAGNLTIPDPDGGTMTGREGNGLVVISW